MKYDFRSLKVGDGLWYPKEYTRLNMSCANSAARNFAAYSSDCKRRKFSTKKQYDRRNKRYGIKIIRTK